MKVLRLINPISLVAKLTFSLIALILLSETVPLHATEAKKNQTPLTTEQLIKMPIKDLKNYAKNREGELKKTIKNAIERHKCLNFRNLPLHLQKSNNEFPAMLKLCPQTYYQHFPIGDRSQFLGPKLFKTYQSNLDAMKCENASQILKHHYYKTHLKAPKLTGWFTQSWRLYMHYGPVPELEFCFALDEFLTAEETIRDHKLKVQPHNTITLLYDPVSQTDFEKIKQYQKTLYLYHFLKEDGKPKAGLPKLNSEHQRASGLIRIKKLFHADYPPAQITLIQLIKTLDYSPVKWILTEYSLLKIMEIKGKLPKKLHKRFTHLKKEIPAKTIENFNKNLNEIYGKKQ